MEYTKGKWMVETDDEGKMYVATEYENIVEVLFDDRHTMKANAQLIAAAPELYEALRAITEEPNFGLPGKLYVMAHNALSRAEGR